MTPTERNKRLAEMGLRGLERVEFLVRNTTYTPREILAFRIPGTRSLAHINAVFQAHADEVNVWQCRLDCIREIVAKAEQA